MYDYTEEELNDVQQTLKQRYKEEVEIFLADCEVQPDKEKDEIVERPALFWIAQGCHFVVVKMNDERYEGRFFYQPDEHFGSGQTQYKDAVNCVTSLLRDQADQARELQGVTTGTTGADLN